MRPQSTGRPGTPVIPAGWSVAPRTVMAGTWTATCALTRPGTGAGVFDPATGQTAPPAPTSIYTGACRVQALARRGDTEAPAAGQGITLGGYLVVVPHTVAALVGDTVTVTAAEDPHLVGRAMKVMSVAYGALSWERDLLCDDNQG